MIYIDGFSQQFIQGHLKGHIPLPLQKVIVSNQQLIELLSWGMLLNHGMDALEVQDFEVFEQGANLRAVHLRDEEFALAV